MVRLASKPGGVSEYREIRYTNDHWKLLRELREKAAKIMLALEHSQLRSVTYGSTARGDVSRHSDADVFVPDVQSSFLIETALEKGGVKIESRLIVQATPNYAMKAHLEIDDATSVSFPLMPLRKVEREFYKFGGEITLQQIRKHLRVKGVDKRLMLIEPTDEGHLESSILGREEEIARMLGISFETVSDRAHALLRRNEVGRTGVFVKKTLSDDETFEMALKKVAEKNPAVRRRLKET
jgi:uncharacterized protein